MPHCRRTAEPDANYREASRLYQSLYASQLDDAYADPQMDEVVRLLHTVHAKSADAEVAKSLLGTIERGRIALAKEREDRERLAAAVAASLVTGPGADLATVAANFASGEDAGVTPLDPYGAGASVSRLNKDTGGCLVAAGTFAEEKTNAGGTVYQLSKSPSCAEKLPGFVGQAVLATDDRIYRRLPESALSQSSPSVPDARLAGGSLARSPQGPGSADAGVGEHHLYYPGQPVPTWPADAGTGR